MSEFRFLRGLRSFRNRVFAGLILVIPLWVTLLAAGFVYRMADGMLEPLSSSPLFEKLFGGFIGDHPALRFLIVVVIGVLILYLLGLVSTNFIVLRLYSLGEKIVLKIPLLKTIYAMTQQIVELFASRASSFKEVVAIEYPSPGTRTLAFVAGQTILGSDGRECLSVFVPTAPMPSAGFLLIVPAESAVKVDISVETAFKILVSAGALTPAEIPRVEIFTTAGTHKIIEPESAPLPDADKGDRSIDAGDGPLPASSGRS